MPERTYRSRRQTLRAQELRSDVSKTERRLWTHLRSSRLGVSFRRQHPVGPFFLDYYCAPLKLAIEIDGPLHDLEYDARRDAWLAENGMTVLRFSVQEIDQQIEAVVEKIAREI